MNPAKAEAAFLDAIGEQPDDDGPRLIYADWLDENGDPARAEFIRSQCRLARMSESEAAATDLPGRAYQLQREHADRWLAPLRAITGGGGHFRRGMIERIFVEASVLVDRAD